MRGGVCGLVADPLRAVLGGCAHTQHSTWAWWFLNTEHPRCRCRYQQRQQQRWQQWPQLLQPEVAAAAAAHLQHHRRLNAHFPPLVVAAGQQQCDAMEEGGGAMSRRGGCNPMHPRTPPGHIVALQGSSTMCAGPTGCQQTSKSSGRHSLGLDLGGRVQKLVKIRNQHAVGGE